MIRHTIQKTTSGNNRHQIMMRSTRDKSVGNLTTGNNILDGHSTNEGEQMKDAILENATEWDGFGGEITTSIYEVLIQGTDNAPSGLKQ